MDSLTELELCKPLPFILGENGAFGITDGTSWWLAIVTREAMEASAMPPEASLARLVRYVELYRGMAEADRAERRPGRQGMDLREGCACLSSRVRSPRPSS